MTKKPNYRSLIEKREMERQEAYRLYVMLLTDALILEQRKKEIEKIIDKALDERDRATFNRYAPLYRELNR